MRETYFAAAGLGAAATTGAGLVTEARGVGSKLANRSSRSSILGAGAGVYAGVGAGAGVYAGVGAGAAASGDDVLMGRVGAG